MQEILIAIKKRWTDQIFDGNKHLELRRNVPRHIPGGRLPIKYPVRVWMYETREGNGAGAIVGFFICPGIVGTKGGYMEGMAASAQVSIQKLREYAGGGWVYGWVVDNPTRLTEPVPLAVIGLTYPPQSWRYLSTEAGKILQGVLDHGRPAK